MRHFRHPAFVAAIAALLTPLSALAQTYEEEIARAGKATATGYGLEVGELRLGPPGAGSHELHLEVANLQDTSREVKLVVSVFPGLGDEYTRHEETTTITSNARLVLSSSYALQRLTPFSRVTVVVETRPAGVVGEETWQQAFRSRAFLGIGNPAVSRDFPELARSSGRRIDAYFLPESLAERDIEAILALREDAISRIDAILDTTFDGTIKLFLYPDAEVKFLHTGHQGMGWAYGDFIAEIYSEDRKLDPFHELAHILTGRLGLLPAFLAEGFATYISEAFGEDALEFVGNPGRSVDEVSAELVRSGRSLPIPDLLAVENIGNTPESAEVEYAQSASLVKFIVERYGPRAVGRLFRAFGPGGATPEQAEAIIESVLDVSVDRLTDAWTRALADTVGKRES
jgi:hypothetical protein